MDKTYSSQHKYIYIGFKADTDAEKEFSVLFLCLA